MVKHIILWTLLLSLYLVGFASMPVLMKAQYDRQQLYLQAEFFPTKASRRDYVAVGAVDYNDAAADFTSVAVSNPRKAKCLSSQIHQKTASTCNAKV